MLLVPAAFAATYTVDTDGEGDATTIAGGLALATDGDTVEVGPGTYVEYVTIEHDVHLVGTDATILGTGAGPVVRMTAGSLSGFSISGGAATAEGDDAGGGVRAEGDVTLGDLVVTGNTASRGGGLFLDGNVTVSDCVVSGNSAELGGGVAVAGGSVRIERSVFETNTAEYGGGLYAGATVTLDHVEATGNVATDGAGVYLIDTTLDADELLLSGNIADAGGGIYADGSSLTVVHARVLANTAGNGNGGGIELAASVVDVQASLFAGNVASSGGAFHVGDGSAATLSNLTITENGSSGSAGGVRVTHEGALTMLNTVIAWSTEGPGLSGKDGATLSVRYGDLWANVGGAVDSETADPTGTDGNLAVDPLFVAFTADGLGDDDLHLAPGSPLIDAGDPTLLDGDGSPSDIGAYGGPFGTTWDDGEDDTGDGDSGDRDTGDGGAKDGGCHCGNPGGSWLGGVWIGLLVTRRRRR